MNGVQIHAELVLQVAAMVAGQYERAVRFNRLDPLDNRPTKCARISRHYKLAGARRVMAVCIGVHEQPVPVAERRLHAVPGHGDASAPRPEEPAHRPAALRVRPAWPAFAS